MHYSKVITTEAQIASEGLLHLEKEPFAFPVSGDPSLMLKGMVCHRKDRLASYYYQETKTKQRIVIHFTAGHLKGDLITLTGKVHVSVPYVIARDGTIYQLFDPSFWSYHLGPGAIGGNKVQSSRTIGIELSNYGPLIKNGNALETIYANDEIRDVYCQLEDTEQYQLLSEPYRNRHYYANFTDAQYDSLILLLRHLTHHFDIPREFLPGHLRFDATEDVLTHKGIVSHVNYRASGKWDIGPAFDWDRVITGLQAEIFVPLTPLEHEINRKKRELLIAQQQLEAQQVRVQVLSAELAEMEQEILNPIPREMALMPGIFSQEAANAVFNNDAPTETDVDEQRIEPGYNATVIEEQEGVEREETEEEEEPETLKIQESELKKLIQSDSITPEEMDKYFVPVFDDPFSGHLQLRSNVEVIPNDATLGIERGAIGNLIVAIANNWARGNRNKKYRKKILAEPDTPRIMSEGDSWFQHPHPKVLDIIDQLSNHYAIYCIGAAGDTVRNMFYEGEFLQAIRDENPSIFLLSGGGNDILGEQFRNYLNDEFDPDTPGSNPSRFLKENFKLELETIASIYRTVFEKLRNKPIQIIVHGYDYVIPWDSRDKGWLGRYMLQKQIDAHADRVAIIREMLDQFNASLSGIAKTYPNVHYIDLRNTVRKEHWYDEIHPSSDGYQDIALKYHELIQRLLEN